MSLLLEALKRAALEKQGKQAGGDSTANSIAPDDAETIDTLEFDIESDSDSMLTDSANDWEITEEWASGSPENQSQTEEAESPDDDSDLFDIDILNEEVLEEERQRQEALDSARNEAVRLEEERALATSAEAKLLAAERAEISRRETEQFEAERLELEQAAEAERQQAEREHAQSPGAEPEFDPVNDVAADDAPRETEAQAPHLELALEEPAQENIAESVASTQPSATNTRESAPPFGQSEDELAHLIRNGHEINRSTKRRARFLYAMLSMTAVGALFAYYFYLLATNHTTNLRQRTFAPTEQIAPAIDVAQDEDDNPGGIVDAAEPLDDDSVIVGAVEPMQERLSAASVQQDMPVREPSSEMVGSIIAAPLLLLTRNDSPPSIEEIESAFIGQKLAAEQPAGRAERQPEQVMVFHDAAPTAVSDVIQKAYKSYQSGNYEQANSLYQKALGLSPRNRDAILGAAATATVRGNFKEAFDLYQLRLSQDPSDSYAKAGVLALASQELPDMGEISRLLKQFPEAAHLHFLKGSVHAANEDWNSAQAAFFEAHHWDKQNPDYAYNLAISLDHLDQVREAQRFYIVALDLSETQSASFSIDELKRRIAELGISP